VAVSVVTRDGKRGNSARATSLRDSTVPFVVTAVESVQTPKARVILEAHSYYCQVRMQSTGLLDPPLYNCVVAPEDGIKAVVKSLDEK
jgi:hypothetical protein